MAKTAKTAGSGDTVVIRYSTRSRPATPPLELPYTGSRDDDEYDAAAERAISKHKVLRRTGRFVEVEVSRSAIDEGASIGITYSRNSVRRARRLARLTSQRGAGKTG